MLNLFVHSVAFLAIAFIGGAVLAAIWNRIIKPVQAKLCPVKVKASSRRRPSKKAR